MEAEPTLADLTDAIGQLAGAVGVTHRTGAAWVEVAHRLEDLPHLGEAFGEGRLSFDQVRVVAAVATPASRSSSRVPRGR